MQSGPGGNIVVNIKHGAYIAWIDSFHIHEEGGKMTKKRCPKCGRETRLARGVPYCAACNRTLAYCECKALNETLPITASAEIKSREVNMLFIRLEPHSP